MRKYKVIAHVGFRDYTKIVEAKNFAEAHNKALDYGHKLSNYGEGPHLFGVYVSPLKKGGAK